jgi:hypothetical protein
MYKQVHKENPSLSPAAVRREAARRMGVDYDTYLKAWKTTAKPTVTTRKWPQPDPNKVAIPEDPYSTFFKGKSGAEASRKISDQISVSALGPDYVPTYERFWTKDLISGQSLSVQSIPLRKPYIRKMVQNGIPKRGTKGWYGTGDAVSDIVQSPLAVRIDGDVYLLNGHHRAIAAAMRGEQLEVRVIDLSGKLGGWKPKINWNAEVWDPVVTSTGGGVFTPVPTPPEVPVPPGGVGKVMTKEEARALEKAVAKEKGLKVGTAASRRAAAERAGMRYEDYLAAWKGQVPKIPGEPIPTPVPKVPIPKPAPLDVNAVRSGLIKDGLDEDIFRVEFGPTGKDKILIRFEHSGTYIDQRRYQAFQNSVLKLREQGYDVTAITSDLYRVQRSVQWSDTGSVRRLLNPGGEVRAQANRIVSNTSKFGDMRESIVDAIERQFTYTGSRYKDLTSVQSFLEDYSGYAPGSNTLAYFTPGSFKRIYLGPKILGKGFTSRHVSLQRSRWFSQCIHEAQVASASGGMESTLAHEYGHFVHTLIPWTDQERLFAVIQEDMGLTGVRGSILKDQTPAITAAMRKYVSKYGSTDSHEFLAEVWAEYTMAGDLARPHIKKWGTMIQDILEARS